MRIPRLAVISSSIAIWYGSVTMLLDLVGRWDAAMHIKTLLPSVLASPFVSPIILAIGFVILYLNTRKPAIVAAVFDAHGNAYEKPSHPVIKYGAYSVLVAFLCVASFVVVRMIINHPKMATLPPAMQSIDKQIIPPNPKIARKRVTNFEHKGDTPCTPKQGRSYSNYLSLPGGPKLQRPMLVLNTGTFPFVVADVNGVSLMAFELVITNRGEASIAKNWELCLVHNGKPVRFEPAKIPVEGIPISAKERVTPDKSLVDNAIRFPIEHARTAGGWLVFKIEDTALTDGWKSGKESIKGSIQFKDYLDHSASFDFDMDPDNKAVDTYVPGAPQ